MMNIKDIKNLKNIYDPSTVYDGYFETYFLRPFVHRYAHFQGAETWTTCLWSLLTWLILTMGIFGALAGLVGLLGPEVGFMMLYIVGGIWCAASVLPIIALISRASSFRGKYNPRPKLLGIDVMGYVVCLLFFVIGLLMMITTLNSGNLNPNADYDPNAEDLKVTEDSVIEEAIFTYEPNAEPSTDTSDMSDSLMMEDGEELSPDESFDPSIPIIPAESPEVVDSL